MNIDPFIKRFSPYHPRACWTVLQLLKGKVDLVSQIKFTLAVNTPIIVDNILDRMPEYRRLLGKRAQ